MLWAGATTSSGNVWATASPWGPQAATQSKLGLRIGGFAAKVFDLAVQSMRTPSETHLVCGLDASSATRPNGNNEVPKMWRA
eukprot:7105133-Alexandrium_andersonii.AAC.1